MMQLKLYFAGALSERALVAQLWDEVQKAAPQIMTSKDSTGRPEFGLEISCTFPWFDMEPCAHDPGSLLARADAEIQAVRDADAVIAVGPGGRGTHFEMGLAFGLGKPVLLVDAKARTLFSSPTETYPCVFHSRLLRTEIGKGVAGFRVLTALLPEPGSVWEHDVRKALYQVVRLGRMQSSGSPLHGLGDSGLTVYYEHEETRAAWFRPLGEFLRRFTREL